MRISGALFAVLFSLAASASGAATTNRLIHSADPYLLQHAHNPVDWFPWGPEAFAKAQAENKPIFLSIGYSTCFWCHVAERDIYSDPAIAALMNRWFVNIKVDREERPDIDRFFIVATELLTQHGAWPNNLFLMPDGRPFYAGSYFPPKDDGDVQGFPTVLAAIHDLWERHRADKVEPAATELMDALRKVGETGQTAAATPVSSQAWRDQAVAILVAGLDPVNGGFGSATSGPKFPQAPALALLVQAASKGRSEEAASHALDFTLQQMTMGAVHDAIGGGFFRYATEPDWSAPHFEKMLSDNAQLLRLVAEHFADTHDPLDEKLIRDIADFILRDLALPEGGFATALDATTDGVEGGSYRWSAMEIRSVLGIEGAQRFLSAYALKPSPDKAGQLDDGPGVLQMRQPLSQTLTRTGSKSLAALLDAFAPSRAALLAARAKRPQPFRDDKLVVATNALAIDALTRAGAVLREPAYRAAAERAADRMWSIAYSETSQTLHHQIFAGRADGEGFLDDYALAGTAALALTAGSNDVWHQRAVCLGDAVLTRFARPDGSMAETGTTPGIKAGDGSALPVSLEETADADVPSSLSDALLLLLRLGREPDGARFALAADRLAQHLAIRIAAHPAMWPSAVTALSSYAVGPVAPVVASAASAFAPAASTSTAPVPDTAEHVHVTATRGHELGTAVDVTIRIDAGFHINAHVPIYDYLVATALDLPGVPATAVVYPAAASFHPHFIVGSLAVYEGTIHLRVRAPVERLPRQGSVKAQACDAQTCLPPATIPFTIKEATAERG